MILNRDGSSLKRELIRKVIQIVMHKLHNVLRDCLLPSKSTAFAIHVSLYHGGGLRIIKIPSWIDRNAGSEPQLPYPLDLTMVILYPNMYCTLFSGCIKGVDCLWNRYTDMVGFTCIAVVHYYVYDLFRAKTEDLANPPSFIYRYNNSYMCGDLLNLILLYINGKHFVYILNF